MSTIGLEDIIKAPHSKSDFGGTRLLELGRCVVDPMYFMRSFMKIQHPIRGALPFEPYPFQEEMIDAFHNNRFTVALTARQMGKCLQSNTIISKDKKSIKIKTLINHSIREKLVEILEDWLVSLVK
jgi:hypothetical protein